MKKYSIPCTVAFCLFLGACAGGNGNGGSNGGTVTVDNPVPVLNSIFPDAALKHQGGFTLTANGSSFVSGATIVFRNQELDTTWVSDTKLTAEVTAAMTAGNSEDAVQAAFQVRVHNPAPGGGDSQSLEFTLKDNPEFAAPVKLSGSDEAYWNGLTGDGDGRIYAWYTDNDADPWDNDATADVKVMRSEDGGGSWSGPYTASFAGCPAMPDLACDGDGRLLMAWLSVDDGGVYFKQSGNHGANWSVGIRADAKKWTYQDTGSAPFIAATDSGWIHLAYERVWDMQWPSGVYARSMGEAKHWIRWTIEPEQQLVVPVLAARDTQVFLLMPEHNPWVASLRNNFRCIFKRSLDEGATWQKETQLSSGRGVSPYPSMDLVAGPQGVVTAAWVWGGAIVRVRASADNGATWTAEKGFVARAGGTPAVLKLAYDDLGNLMIAWVEDGVVYFRRSVNNGATWSTPKAVTSQAVSPDKGVPLGLMATQDNRILVTWVKNHSLFKSEGTAY